jgi:hypothetical protein
MALLCAFLIIACLAIFFAKKWHDASKLDNVYILSSDNTLTAIRTDGSMARSSYEIMAFAKVFLEKAFAHSEYSWEENLTEVTDFMDKESARLFLSKMDETIEALYKERNAISTVSLKEIEVDVDTQPYEVLLYYSTMLRFASLGEAIYEDAEVEGGIYFQIEPLSRSTKNPFGMQIRKLKFLQKKSDS